MSIDSVSQRVVTVPTPKSAEASGKRPDLKSGSKSLREMDEAELRKALWDRYKDVEESEIRELCDDWEKPFSFYCRRFTYKNKAQIRLDEEIEKAKAEYRRQRALLPPGPYDAINPPHVPGAPYLLGGVRPFTITDDVRPRLIRFCNLALDKYNAECENQGEVFVFDDLIKSTRALVSGYMYYITFQAKAGDVTKTFQAQVWHRMPGQGPPVVDACSLKPS